MDEGPNQERAADLMRKALAQLNPASDGEVIAHLRRAIAALDTVAAGHGDQGGHEGVEG